MIRRLSLLLAALALTSELYASTCTTLGADTATSNGTAVVGGLDAKGSWVQFTASSGHVSKLIYLFFSKQPSDATSFLIDIGTGGAGSETVILPNLVIDNNTTSLAGVFGPLYVNIATSTRIAVRAEADGTAGGDETIFVTLLICDEAIPELTSYTYATYGAISGATPKATSIDPGGTANTKGSYTQLVATAQSSIEQMWLEFGINNNNATTTASWLVDVAIGSGGSETVVLSNLFISVHSTTDFSLPFSLLVPGDSYAGQRIAVRAQCTIIDATDRLLTVTALTAAGTVVSGGGGGGLRIAGPGGLVAR